MEHLIVEGIHFFNAGRFFASHEALEAVWLNATGERKTFLHGLIQVAAAFHHYTRGNAAGFRSLLEKGCAKLERFGKEDEGLDVGGLLLQLRSWHEYLGRMPQATRAAPSLPVIKFIPPP